MSSYIVTLVGISLASLTTVRNVGVNYLFIFFYNYFLGLLMPLLIGQWRETGNRAERRGMTRNSEGPSGSGLRPGPTAARTIASVYGASA